MKITTITTGTWEPLDLDEIKRHLRIEEGETADDLYLGSLRTAARQRVEACLGRALNRRTCKLYLDNWPSTADSLDLPYAPLASIPSTGVVYKNSDGNSTTWSSTAWEVDTASEPGRLCLRYNDDWPTATLWNVNPISVEFVTGYSTRSAVPAAIKQAMLLTISDMYENRESVVVGQQVNQIPGVVDLLLAPYRMYHMS